MSENPKVLFLSPKPASGQLVFDSLADAGFDVKRFANPNEALAQADDGKFSAALVTIDGLANSADETVHRLSEIRPSIEVIVLGSDDNKNSARHEFHDRVFASFAVPLDVHAIVRSVGRAVEHRNLLIENERLARELELERRDLKRGAPIANRRILDSSVLVGESESMVRLRQFVSEVAPTDMTILLRGESGTGKDIVSRLIHEASHRDRLGSFVKINCPAIPETLLESELFGHEPGAFTGADRRKPGRFELAAAGTIFLDEIGEIPMAVQVKLLQAIEHKQFSRLGGSKTIHTDARIIAATNAPLEQMIARDQFRSDLFYRLNQISIVLPPLRERTEDIPILVQHFLAQEGAQSKRVHLTIPPGLMSRLIAHPWPGNVRELETVVKRFALTGREDSIESVLNISFEKSPNDEQQDRLRQSEIRTILAALTQARWNQRQAAQLLGISYSSLRRRISKYNLKNRWLEHVASDGSRSSRIHP